MKKVFFLLSVVLALALIITASVAMATDSRDAPTLLQKGATIAAINTYGQATVKLRPDGSGKAVVETAFLPQISPQVAIANATLIAQEKGAVVAVNDAAVAARSEVLAPAIKDFLVSSSASARTYLAEKPVKEGVRHVLKKPLIGYSLENNNLPRTAGTTA